MEHYLTVCSLYNLDPRVSQSERDCARTMKHQRRTGLGQDPVPHPDTTMPTIKGVGAKSNHKKKRKRKWQRKLVSFQSISPACVDLECGEEESTSPGPVSSALPCAKPDLPPTLRSTVCSNYVPWCEDLRPKEFSVFVQSDFPMSVAKADS